jgi:AraC-like DNA-binding protein
MDALFDILRATRLTGGLFLDAEFTAPWCVGAKVGPEDCTPFAPEPRSIIAYHYVSAGKALLKTDGESPITVEAGEIVILPRNDGHLLGSNLNCRPVSAEQLIRPGDEGGLARIVHGGGGDRTCILCGFLGSETLNDPVIAMLPKVLKLNVAEGASGQWIESSFRFAAQELSQGRPQPPPVLARLAELLFVEAVHRYFLTLKPEQSAWLTGIRDPVVARALGLLHGEVGRRWTTEDLAREVGASRSAFAARFSAAMGEPPMRYLANWRMQAAAGRMIESSDPIPRIALALGYESEAAFSRAFRRVFGMPPAAWRRQRLK